MLGITHSATLAPRSQPSKRETRVRNDHAGSPPPCFAEIHSVWGGKREKYVHVQKKGIRGKMKNGAEGAAIQDKKGKVGGDTRNDSEDRKNKPLESEMGNGKEKKADKSGIGVSAGTIIKFGMNAAPPGSRGLAPCLLTPQR